MRKYTWKKALETGNFLCKYLYYCKLGFESHKEKLQMIDVQIRCELQFFVIFLPLKYKMTISHPHDRSLFPSTVVSHEKPQFNYYQELD